MDPADLLRNLAIIYENKGNLEVAKALIGDARTLRPDSEDSKRRAEQINRKIEALP